MSQHRKPCPTCPFLRTCTPGALGGSPAQTFIGQTFGAFWIPCHERLNYDDPNWRTQYDTPQCAGAAIFRSNAFPATRPSVILVLPQDKDMVFGSAAEFLAHHKRIPLAVAQEVLAHQGPDRLWIKEMQDANARLINPNHIAKT